MGLFSWVYLHNYMLSSQALYAGITFNVMENFHFQIDKLYK